MFNCESCIKNDVCAKKVNSNVLTRNLELNSNVQALRNIGFKIDLECLNYAQVQAKILGGKYEH